MKALHCEHCVLRARSSVIRDLSTDQIDDFSACSVLTFYKRRQVIFHDGTPANGLYILCQGAVKLYQSDRFGRDYILGIVLPGEVLGELPLAPTETYSTSAEALTDSQLRFLPRERLIPFIMAHPMTGVRLIEALSRALSTARRAVRDLALKPAESRLAGLLLQLLHARGQNNRDDRPRAVLNYTRRELAEMIGVSTETAIRMLSRFKQRRLIETCGREVIITDVHKLGRLAAHGSISSPRLPTAGSGPNGAPTNAALQ